MGIGWNLTQTLSVCGKSGVAIADDVMFIGAPLDSTSDYVKSGTFLSWHNLMLYIILCDTVFVCYLRQVEF